MVTIRNEFTYRVCCKHENERYCLFYKLVTVRQDDEGFWWNLHPFGCSKTYSSAYTAIRAMLQDHGCTDIQIVRW